jgi:hypothetical protein
LCVSSIAKTMAVSGERIVPPIIAPMPISAQIPSLPVGMIRPKSAPTAPPMMSNGASTPPDVPEPSATDQIIDFTIARRTIAMVVISPLSSAAILS